MLSTFQFADHVVGIIVNSDINEQIIKSINERIEEKLEDHQKINLFIELKSGQEISFNAFLKDISFKSKHLHDFYKLAIVTDLDWFKTYTKFKDLVMDGEIRSFATKERIEAINWISQ